MSPSPDRLAKPRFVAVDEARGLALSVMVYYHAWRWLAAPSSRDEQWFSADWWLCAARLLAAPLFILCFGTMLGILHRNRSSTELRRKLWPRALQTFLAYKLLSALEFWARGFSLGALWQGLTYQSLANWYQVLNFYALFLFGAPWVLPVFFRLRTVPRLALLIGLAGATAFGQMTDWGHPALQALVVGKLPYLAFPFLPWSLVALVGIWHGACWPETSDDFLRRAGGVAAISFVLLFAPYWPSFNEFIVFLAWKNPPRLAYLAAALSWALIWLRLCLLHSGRTLTLPSGRNPLQLLGRHPLWLYLFHVSFILLVFGLRHRHALPSAQAHGVAAALLLLTYFGARCLELVHAARRP